MSSLFDNARGLLRASIADCFGSPKSVINEQGDTLSIIGYVKKSQHGERITFRLLTSETLPDHCTMAHEGLVYSLSYAQSLPSGNGASGLTNEYTLVRHAKGSQNEWSEFN
ncbi:hypothetical protein F0249_17175 [Vibrio sp. 03-59-1]|uniref:hypothetical protein n=1 Tax=Vibrio sp. 03-59-1 TaxID=2607607 RepID=UPI001493DAF8|nr:hypothetical protein [Vibrio sp. 03-59-1]NOH85530.1 hypothetical protein [Vibrio sp. 03-59-1]